MKTVIQKAKGAKEKFGIDVKVDKTLAAKQYHPSSKLDKVNKLVSKLNLE